MNKKIMKLIASLMAVTVSWTSAAMNARAVSLETNVGGDNKVTFNYTDPDAANAKIADLMLQVHNLEQENKELKLKLSNLFEEEQQYIITQNSDLNVIMDVNRDGTVDANDASFVLTYYAYSSVGYRFYTYGNYYNWIFPDAKGQGTPIG